MRKTLTKKIIAKSGTTEKKNYYVAFQIKILLILNRGELYVKLSLSLKIFAVTS